MPGEEGPGQEARPEGLQIEKNGEENTVSGNVESKPNEDVVQIIEKVQNHVPNSQNKRKNSEMKVPIENQMNQTCICQNYGYFKDWDQVQCDNCDVWYHQFCVKLTRTPVVLLTRFEGSMKWFCFRCLQK